MDMADNLFKVKCIPRKNYYFFHTKALTSVYL